MKAEIGRQIRLFVMLLAAAVLCIVLYDLVDRVYNGVFVDWFSNRYMTRRRAMDVDGIWHYYWQPDWGAVKRLLFRVLFFSAVSAAAFLYGYSRIHARREVKRFSARTAEQIRRYMSMQGEAEEIFPEECAQIALQMARLRAERLRGEQTAREEAQRKNDLITYLAHDLKTPLTSVIGYLSLLDEAPDLPAAQREKYLRISLEKARRLEHLINEFFEITRYNLQQVILEKEKVDLSFLLVQLSDEFYPLCRTHGNRIVQEVEDRLFVYGDAVKLARVFQNLLKNAVAYSYENTEIRIEAKKREKEIWIRFQNRGVTVPKQKLNALFEKFFRLEDARTTNSGSAGLGLAIARDIVTLHGGTITAQSEAEVTSFLVTLPAFEEAESAAAGSGDVGGKEV